MNEWAEWVEHQCTLHQWVEVHYVVDGYEVQVVGEDERERAIYKGDTVADAMRAAVNGEASHE